MQLAVTPLRQYGQASAGGRLSITRSLAARPSHGTAAAEQDGRVYPQMGLALASRMLDADLASMRIEDDTLRSRGAVDPS